MWEVEDLSPCCPDRTGIQHNLQAIFALLDAYVLPETLLQGRCGLVWVDLGLLGLDELLCLLSLSREPILGEGDGCVGCLGWRSGDCGMW